MANRGCPSRFTICGCEFSALNSVKSSFSINPSKIEDLLRLITSCLHLVPATPRVHVQLHRIAVTTHFSVWWWCSPLHCEFVFQLYAQHQSRMTLAIFVNIVRSTWFLLLPYIIVGMHQSFMNTECKNSSISLFFQKSSTRICCITADEAMTRLFHVQCKMGNIDLNFIYFYWNQDRESEHV